MLNSIAKGVLVISIPLLWDKPVNVWLGIILIFLLGFQVLTGKGIIKLPFTYHRVNAMAIVLIAAVHAYYGLGMWFFGFKIG
ncbi:hypothetical protein FDZ73_23490 [bacterium]|nr:MAG: hypothetical protein FDZ73_23490 [bacterium]